LIEEIAASCGGLDGLVNNAGTCFMSEFPDIPAGDVASGNVIILNQGRDVR